MRTNYKYKMIAYDEDGNEYYTDRDNNPAFFDRYKHKSCYKIVILEKVGNRWSKVIYSEL